jgi:hypothetical protein
VKTRHGAATDEIYPPSAGSLTKEITMYRVYAPFLIQFTEEARAVLPISPSEAAQAAFRTIAAAGQGFDIAYMPIEMKGLCFVAASRITKSGTVVIEVDCAQPGLTPRVITGHTYRSSVKLNKWHQQFTHRRL